MTNGTMIEVETNITRLDLSSATNLEKIDSHSFNNSSLQSVIFPTSGSLKYIGAYAFNESTGLTQLSLPEGLIEIGNYAFQYCSITGELVIPSTITTIGKRAFRGNSITRFIIKRENSDGMTLGSGWNWNTNNSDTEVVYDAS